MKYTRTDSVKLKAAIDTAKQKLTDAMSALEPLMVLLNEEERLRMLRPRTDFPIAARKVMSLMGFYADIAKTASYDAAAVEEDLNNLELLEPVLLLNNRLQQMLSDSKLAWSAEAYEPTLVAYRLAKANAPFSNKLAEDLTGISDYFSAPFRAKKSDEPTGGK